MLLFEIGLEVLSKISKERQRVAAILVYRIFVYSIAEGSANINTKMGMSGTMMDASAFAFKNANR